jgi:hypothetical protein
MTELVGPDTVLAVASGVRTMPLGDELTVFDASTGRALALNRTAADIFALVDGSTTVREICQVLGHHHHVALARIQDAVTATAEALVRQGAVTTAAAPPA